MGNGFRFSANGGGGCPDEESPLLGKSPPRSMLSRFRKSMNDQVSRSWADLVLLLCYVVTGLLDSSSTQVWGTFVSMQTGLVNPFSLLSPRDES